MEQLLLEPRQLPAWSRSLIEYAIAHRRLNTIPHMDFSVAHHIANLEPVLITTVGEIEKFAFAVYYSPTDLLLTSFIWSEPDQLREKYEFQQLCSAYVIGHVELTERGNEIHIHHFEAGDSVEDDLNRGTAPKSLEAFLH